jgi:hypothetical protein
VRDVTVEAELMAPEGELMVEDVELLGAALMPPLSLSVGFGHERRREQGFGCERDRREEDFTVSRECQ